MRRALNYAVDREGLVKLLNGSAKPAAGLYPKEDPLFGSPANHYKYDPEKAKALLTDVTYVANMNDVAAGCDALAAAALLEDFLRCQ